MSRKWQRTKRWDDEHLRGPYLAPVKAVLRAFSSIRLAIVLLVFVALYGVVASVPIGLLTLGVSKLIVGVSLLAAVAVAALAPVTVVRSVLRPRGVRFAATVIGCVVGGAAGAGVWYAFIWPALHYDPATGAGLRLFPEFVEQTRSTTLRRLPGFEMTELEFYSWWPLRVVLLLFVANMFIATVRRIEFNVKNLGVLTVHTGIIVIALGSVYYQALKLEGDTILLAGSAPAGGTPGEGPAQRVFYDGTRVALYVSQDGRRNAVGSPFWQQRKIDGLPRYNAYNLRAGVPDPENLLSNVGRSEPREISAAGRELSIDVPGPAEGGGIDPDINFRVIGYAPYADLHEDRRLYSEEEAAWLPLSKELEPVRALDLYFTPPGEQRAEDPQPVSIFTLQPETPARRVTENDLIAVEMTSGMSEQRWRDLQAPLPPGVQHGLIIEVPAAEREDGATPRVVVPAAVGNEYEIGQTGWSVAVKSVEPEPPFPIITEGYEGATSSVAVVRISPPDDHEGGSEPYDRWVYHRFPQINQDLLDGVTASGRPRRRDADPAIRVAYIDASKLQFYADRTSEGAWRAIARPPGQDARVFTDVGSGELIEDIIPRIDVALREGWPHAETIEHPIPVPEDDREKRFIGTHQKAMLALEISVAGLGAADQRGEPSTHREVVWLPFTQYMGLGEETQRTVELPDGRTLRLAFGRLQRPFPNFRLRLLDFEMIAYDHRGAPRDYQSRIGVEPAAFGSEGGFEPYQRIAKLNAPLRAPHAWSDDRPWVANAGMWLFRGLNPNSFKISQAGWDQEGWKETQALADQGLLPEPHARFTIMQVGNNPGIHVIALGGVLMGLGIPWAFYVKPWLVRREKRRLAEHVNRARTRSEEDRRQPAGTPSPVPAA